jgi:hypothetical protein
MYASKITFTATASIRDTSQFAYVTLSISRLISKLSLTEGEVTMLTIKNTMFSRSQPSVTSISQIECVRGMEKACENIDIIQETENISKFNPKVMRWQYNSESKNFKESMKDLATSFI